MSDEETINDIKGKINALAATYITDNAWFRFYVNGQGFDAAGPQRYAHAAGKAYVHVSKAKVPLLLGDTKIRSEKELLDNFGVSDAEAADAPPVPADPAARAAQATIQRAGAPSAAGGPAPIGAGPPPGSSASASAPGASAPPSTTPSATAPGGILSNAKWSPMLNDAFILGGINNGKQFVLSLVGDDKSFFQSIAAGSGAAGGSAAKEQQLDAGRRVWKDFFNAKSYLLWDRGYPRVFARELLGLAKFGYVASPTSTNLSFDAPAPGCPTPGTFADYLTFLSANKFQENKARPVLQAVAEYLFKDKTALDPVITRAGG